MSLESKKQNQVEDKEEMRLERENENFAKGWEGWVDSLRKEGSLNKGFVDFIIGGSIENKYDKRN